MPSNPSIKTTMRYLTIADVALQTKTSVEEIIHSAAHGDFPLYVLADNWNVLTFTKDSESEEWIQSSPKPWKYSGPVRLYPRDLMRLEANPSTAITKLMGDTANYIGYEPEEEWQFRLFEEPVSLKNCTLVMLQKDYNSPNETDAGEKPLKPKVRSTLLKIIAALASGANYDLNHATKSAEALEKVTELLGNRVSARSIEDYLKEARAYSESTFEPTSSEPVYKKPQP